jgi:diguanylate cyclase (GGDEF)-like protein
VPGRDPLEAAYERRIRLASEVATWGIAAILVASAALPTTPSLSRLGLLFTAALLGAFSILWFHIIPERIFGPLRFTIGTALTQVVAGLLLMLTGGSGSPYFVFFLFPTLATTFAMRVASTLVVGAIGLVALVALIIGDGVFADSPELFQLGAVRVSAFIAVIAMTALIARTMQEARTALRQRSNELASQNVELEVSHSTALAIARSRDLGELLRAVFDAASTAIGAQRVFFFEGAEASERGWTVGGEGAFQSFDADRRLRDSPRQRAMRTRRTIVVNDMTDEPMVGERVKTSFGVASGLFVPLIHRGGLVGLVAFTDTKARTWTAREVRLAEIIAESVAPSVASFLAIEEVREEREVLAGRMKVLEGMNQLVEALALAQDEATTGQVAARAVAQGFRLIASTTLFVDPSVALLEPVGIAGAARVHPVVNGPTNCPAIRSGRVFQVTAATDAVICPYMPFSEGSGGYVCVPLLAGGEPMGAMFMEPTVGSVVEDTFVRAAADRVALSLANRRVLETAQRQATTDGLTGLSNRHLLREQLRLLQSLATRHGQPYSVIAFDVDGLKQVNDTFGHEMGDLALRSFANIVRKTIRTSDIGVRTGGDEFLILIPLGGLEQARILAERLRDALAAQGRAEPHTAVTVSAGVAAWRTGRSAEQVLEAADEMLYAAKRAGRDQVAVETAPAAAESGTSSP